MCLFFVTYVAHCCSRNNRSERNLPRQSLLLPSLNASAAHLATHPARWPESVWAPRRASAMGEDGGEQQKMGAKKEHIPATHRCSRCLCSRWRMSFAAVFFFLLLLLLPALKNNNQNPQVERSVSSVPPRGENAMDGWMDGEFFCISN